MPLSLLDLPDAIIGVILSPERCKVETLRSAALACRCLRSAALSHVHTCRAELTEDDALEDVLACAASLPALRTLAITGFGYVRSAPQLPALVQALGGRLQRLKLAGDRLSTPALRALIAIPTLHDLVVHAHLGPQSVRALSTHFPELPELRHLELVRSGALAAGVRALAARLSCATQLETLSLHGSDMGNSGGSALAEGITCLRQLKVLALDSGADACNQAPALDSGAIGEKAIRKLCTRLTCLGELEVLNLTGNDVSARPIEAISHSLHALPRPCRLRELILARTLMGGTGASALAKLLPQLPHLRHLDLRCSTWCASEDGMNELTSQLAHVPLLQDLDLSHNVPMAPVPFAAALGSLTDLRRLRLRNTTTTLIGMPALAAALTKLSHLELLDVADNSLMDSGLHHLLRCLPSLPQLRHLDLGNNSLRAPGIAALASQFSCLSRLTELSLAGCMDENLEDSAATVLAGQLAHLSALRHLDLSDHCFSETGLAAIAAQLASLHNLRRLDVTQHAGCAISAAADAAVFSAVVSGVEVLTGHV